MKDLKGGELNEIQTKLGATLCGEYRTPQAVRRDAGRRDGRASGAPGAGAERLGREGGTGR
jgi:hypothetical protein